MEQVWFPGAHADIGEDKTAGGIIIPDTSKEKPSQGEITAVGPGGRDEAGKLMPIGEVKFRLDFVSLRCLPFRSARLEPVKL